MPPTATILFPEFLADDSTRPLAEVRGFQRIQRLRTAVVSFDDGSEQKRLRGRVTKDFRLRLIPYDPTLARNLHTFTSLVGDGSVNFGFYEPESLKYQRVKVGVTDGNETVLTDFRYLSSWEDILVGGISNLAGFLGITTDVGDLKRDELNFDSFQLAGLDVEMTGIIGNKLYICRMTGWSDYPYAGGEVEAAYMNPAYTHLPVFPRVWDFQFSEIGG